MSPALDGRTPEREGTLPEGYRVRRARAGELAALTEIERAAARLFEDLPLELDIPDEVTTVSGFREAFDAGRLWVAEGPDGSPVGFAHVEMLGEEPHLEELDVHPDHGRRGLGSVLVQTVCAWAAAEGYAGVGLTTFRGVPWNQPFYARMGFRVLGPADLTPAQREKMRQEHARGLREEQRVMMRFQTAIRP